MGRRCSICDSAEQAPIDRALIRNEVGYREIAKRFGISISALFRHKQNHLPGIVAKGLAATPVDAPVEDNSPAEKVYSPAEEDPAITSRAVATAREQQATDVAGAQYAIDVVAQLRAINAACLEVLKKARAAENHGMLLRAVDRISRQIELQAKLLGQIQDGQTVNVAVMPEWLGIRQVVIEALRPYPEARLAVARALTHAGA